MHRKCWICLNMNTYCAHRKLGPKSQGKNRKKIKKEKEKRRKKSIKDFSNELACYGNPVSVGDLSIQFSEEKKNYSTSNIFSIRMFQMTSSRPPSVQWDFQAAIKSHTI